MSDDSLRHWWCDERAATRRISVAYADAIALDVETSGLRVHRDQVTEIGLVRVADGTVAYHWTARFDDGISTEAAAEAARIAVGERPVVIHHALFDLGFLRVASGAWRGKSAPAWLCTWRAFGAGPSLDALAAAAGVHVTGRHTAAGDAAALAAIMRIAWRGRNREGRLGDAAAWAPRLRPRVALRTAVDAVVRAFPVEVPLQVTSPVQRSALNTLRKAVTCNVVDPVLMAEAVTVARTAGVVRGHVEQLLVKDEVPNGADADPSNKPASPRIERLQQQ